MRNQQACYRSMSLQWPQDMTSGLSRGLHHILACKVAAMTGALSCKAISTDLLLPALQAAASCIQGDSPAVAFCLSREEGPRDQLPAPPSILWTACRAASPQILHLTLHSHLVRSKST